MPWIYRWSRPLMAAIAMIGAIGTGYLAFTKLSGANAACPTTGCEQVLNSAYGSLFGLPLPLFGCLAYIAVAVLAIAPLLLGDSDERQELRTTIDNSTGWLLFLSGTGMAVFSAYLMFIMFTEIKPDNPCIYCVVSAILSGSLFLLSTIGRAWNDIGSLIFSGLIAAMVVLVGTLGLYSGINAPATANGASTVPGTPGPPVTTIATPGSIALAEHLTKIGAKMYGAYWCPHCHEQKDLFGKEGAAKVPYIECADDGQNPQPDLCRKAGIKGFPTWELNGKQYSGIQKLDELAKLSGYSGPKL
jgi:uncharacterized membrane protein/glutaredoxin